MTSPVDVVRRLEPSSSRSTGPRNAFIPTRSAAYRDRGAFLTSSASGLRDRAVLEDDQTVGQGGRLDGVGSPARERRGSEPTPRRGDGARGTIPVESAERGLRRGAGAPSSAARAPARAPPAPRLPRGALGRAAADDPRRRSRSSAARARARRPMRAAGASGNAAFSSDDRCGNRAGPGTPRRPAGAREEWIPAATSSSMCPSRTTERSRAA